MLRHAGALRPGCSRPVATRSRSSYQLSLRTTAHYREARAPAPATQCSSRQPAFSPPKVLVCAYLHKHAAGRIRKRGNGLTFAPIRNDAIFLGGLPLGKGWGQDGRGALDAGLSTRRTIFGGSGGWFGKWVGVGSGGSAKSPKPKDTMDEETQRSIRQGDSKTKKSMETVKVSRGGVEVFWVCSPPDGLI